MRLAGFGVAADLVGVGHLLQRALDLVGHLVGHLLRREAPGQKACTTMARKVNGGSSSWPSWK